MNRRLQNTSDGYGIRSNITAYLDQFNRPAISQALGKPFKSADHKTVIKDKPVTKPKPAANKMPGNEQTVKPPAQASAKRINNNQSSQETAPGHRAANKTAATQLDSKLVNTAAGKETDESRPVIEDRTRLQRPQSTQQVQESSEVGTRPNSPLSLFSDGQQKEIDEYDFEPIEPPPSQPDEKEDDEEVNQEFLDTVVETAEALTEDKTQSSSDKPGYVKEMLIL